jgi:hypothetical protein
MKTLSLITLVVLMAFVSGCASTSGSPQAASGPPANVAGTWSGSTIGAGGVPVTMNLKQTGGTVAGDIDVGGRSDLSGPLKGTVDANSISFKLDTGYGSTGTLNVKGNSIDGFVGGSGLNLQRR